MGSTFGLSIALDSSSWTRYDGAWQTSSGDNRVYRVFTSTDAGAYRIYAYATSTAPCYINRIKIEEGTTYTGWYNTPDTGALYMEFNSSNTNYFNAGLSIFKTKQTDPNYLLLTDSAVEIYKTGDKVASFGSTVTIGKTEPNQGNIFISNGYIKLRNSDDILVDIGYFQNTNIPYMTIGDDDTEGEYNYTNIVSGRL